MFSYYSFFLVCLCLYFSSLHPRPPPPPPRPPPPRYVQQVADPSSLPPRRRVHHFYHYSLRWTSIFCVLCPRFQGYLCSLCSSCLQTLVFVFILFYFIVFYRARGVCVLLYTVFVCLFELVPCDAWVGELGWCVCVAVCMVVVVVVVLSGLLPPFILH